MKNIALTAITGLLFGLSGCGGGGGGGSSTVVPQGVYEGTTSQDEYFNLLVLENGQYYSINGDIQSAVFGVQSLSTGTGSASNGKFVSTNFKQFFSDGLVLTGTLDATFRENDTFSGKLSDGSSSVTFSGEKIDSSVYNYNQSANLANITGTWNNLFTLTGEAVTLNIAANGAYTGTGTSGCNFSGQLTPRASGKNVFDVTVNFGGAPCELANQSATGHAVEFDLGGGDQQLAVAGTNASGNIGTLLLGTR